MHNMTLISTKYEIMMKLAFRLVDNLVQGYWLDAIHMVYIVASQNLGNGSSSIV
jgi:hypothetical protein